MIKVNVGLSRKLSRDYQSAGYSINVEGEVNAPLDDPEALIERIKEYYDLADEALRQQIERRQNLDSLGSHDEERMPGTPTYPTPVGPSGDQPPGQQFPASAGQAGVAALVATAFVNFGWWRNHHWG